MSTEIDSLITVDTEARAILQACPHRDLQQLHIRLTTDHKLRIHGLVHSYYHKQLAQELLRELAAQNGFQIANETEMFDALID